MQGIVIRTIQYKQRKRSPDIITISKLYPFKLHSNLHIQRYNPLREHGTFHFSDSSVTSPSSSFGCSTWWEWLTSQLPPSAASQHTNCCSRLAAMITAQLELLHLPGELSCPAGRPLQPGPTWQRWSPRSCWRLWWPRWCAPPSGCNKLRNRLAPSDRSTSHSPSWSQPDEGTVNMLTQRWAN